MYSQNYSLNSKLKIWMITLLVMIVLIILVGGLTRLTDSGLSITRWELFIGLLPPLTNDKWIEYFDLYKTIPEYKDCLLYTSPSPRDYAASRMPSSA